jgi:hypothetical protein
MPERIQRLPLDLERGYPVPWFVVWIDGKPDFRVISSERIAEAYRQRRCWVCGEGLGVHVAFVIGPMCAINRISAEPPSHRDCAVWSAQACPFLTRPHMHRREDRLPEGVKINENHLDRNPGVTLVWITKDAEPIRNTDGGVLFHFGDAEEVFYFKEGRKATVDEIMESIDSGMPVLRDSAVEEGSAAQDSLARRYAEVEALVKQTA